MPVVLVVEESDPQRSLSVDDGHETAAPGQRFQAARSPSASARRLDQGRRRAPGHTHAAAPGGARRRSVGSRVDHPRDIPQPHDVRRTNRGTYSFLDTGLRWLSF